MACAHGMCACHVHVLAHLDDYAVRAWARPMCAMCTPCARAMCTRHAHTSCAHAPTRTCTCTCTCHRGGYRVDIQGPRESRWGYTAPTAADWNGDGLLDLVSSDNSARTLVYLRYRTAAGKLALMPGAPLMLDGLELHGTRTSTCMWTCMCMCTRMRMCMCTRTSCTLMCTCLHVHCLDWMHMSQAHGATGRQPAASVAPWRS